jgi:tetratricopeptide (TPR) repeat protein
MKRFTVIILMILFAGSVFAQNREITSCWNYLKEGFLDDAYASIMKAAENEKTKDYYKTWWYYGRTHQEISVTEKAKYQSLCEDCADKAFDAYLKSLKLNFQDPEMKKLDLTKEIDIMKFFKALSDPDIAGKIEDQQSLIDIITVRLPALANGFVNEGVDAFKNEDYETALAKFEKSLTVSTLAMKADTQVIYFASLAALNAKNWESVVNYNSLLKQLKFGKNTDEKVLVYQNLAKGHIELNDTAKFISTLEEGMEKYPDNSYPLVIDLFNYYVDGGDNAKALEYISLAIKDNPNDAQFYVIKGTLLEEMSQAPEARAEYTKAIEIDPNNFDANYSLGAYYYNSAADTLSWANDNIPPTEPQKYDKVKQAADDLFKQALPYLEKAKAQKEDDLNVLTTLKTIYYRVGDIENHDKIKAKIDELTQ